MRAAAGGGHAGGGAHFSARTWSASHFSGRAAPHFSAHALAAYIGLAFRVHAPSSRITHVTPSASRSRSPLRERRRVHSLVTTARPLAAGGAHSVSPRQPAFRADPAVVRWRIVILPAARRSGRFGPRLASLSSPWLDRPAVLALCLWRFFLLLAVARRLTATVDPFWAYGYGDIYRVHLLALQLRPVRPGTRRAGSAWRA